MIWLLAVLAVLALPLAVERARKPVASRRAGGVPGEMVTLPNGATHVVREGPEDGPVVVLVHGVTTPSYVWSGVAPLLARGGYRVIRFDLFGRGFSDRPLGRQDPAFFVDQLNALLLREEVSEPVVLIGYSMGGAVVSAKAAEAPGDLSALVLVAATGLAPPNVPWVAKVPVLGEWVLWVFGGWLIRRRLAGEMQEVSAIDDFAAREAAETRTRGLLPAVLSALRQTVRRDMSFEHAAIARAGLPVLAIWAGRDLAVPPASADRLSVLNPDARQHLVDEADHGLPHTRPGEVADEILRFLAARSGGG